MANRLLSVLLLCILTLTILCGSALAEDSAEAAAIPAPVPLAEQLSILDEFDEDYQVFADPDLIVGKWIPAMLVYQSILFDTEAVISVTFTLNEDGTATVDDLGNSQPCVYQLIRNEKDNLAILLTNSETGEVLIDPVLYPNDELTYSDSPMMIFGAGSGLVAVSFKENHTNFIPADELSPVVQDADAGDIYYVSDQWILVKGIVNNRMIKYDELETINTHKGMKLELSVYMDESVPAEFSLHDITGTRMDFVASPSADEPNAFLQDDYNLTAILNLHEDGTLSMEWSGATLVFEVFTIDPLTEYTEKDIVKAVQEAMNAEGYECGTPDGISGKKTKAAIEAFQNDNGLTATGTVTEELLECLRGKGYSL